MNVFDELFFDNTYLLYIFSSILILLFFFTEYKTITSIILYFTLIYIYLCINKKESNYVIYLILSTFITILLLIYIKLIESKGEINKITQIIVFIIIIVLLKEIFKNKESFINIFSNFTYYLLKYIPCIIYNNSIKISEDYKKLTHKNIYILFYLLIIIIIIYNSYSYFIHFFYNGNIIIDEKDRLNKFIYYETFIDIAQNEENKKIPFIHKPLQFINNLFSNKTNSSNSKDNKTNDIKNKKKYKYGLSFWIYLDTNIMEKPERLFIMSFNKLKVELNNEKCLEFYNNNEMLYKSEQILFQKWNHIVVNYSNGTLDIFINNNLVSTHINISPYIQNNNKFNIGTYNNNDLISVTKFRYFENPLSTNKIKQLYYEI